MAKTALLDGKVDLMQTDPFVTLYSDAGLAYPEFRRLITIRKHTVPHIEYHAR